MIVGDPSKFAIESEIPRAYERLSFLAIGNFVIRIQGACYGSIQPDATMLACSYDEVERRISQRGTHLADFASDLSASSIADAFRVSVYGANLCDMPPKSASAVAFEAFKKTDNFVWAPDGDAAFDDGSYVLQFDVNDQVRLIAFRCKSNGLHDPDTLKDIWMSSNDFYNTLQLWHRDFQSEWEQMPKEIA